MPDLATSLASLVQNIVPESRKDENLRSELIAHCQDVLGRCVFLYVYHFLLFYNECAFAVILDNLVKQISHT